MGSGPWRRACKRCGAGEWRSRMQLDAARMRPVLLDCGRRGTFFSVSGRCAAPSLSMTRTCGVYAGQACARSLRIGCVPARPRSKWRVARLPLADAMVRLPACAGEWLELLWRATINVDRFQAAAWIFKSDAVFWRAASGRAAQIITTGVAWRAWWCRCEQQRPVRSPRAALVSNSARDVISACATTWDRLVC